MMMGGIQHSECLERVGGGGWRREYLANGLRVKQRQRRAGKEDNGIGIRKQDSSQADEQQQDKEEE